MGIAKTKPPSMRGLSSAVYVFQGKGVLVVGPDLGLRCYGCASLLQSFADRTRKGAACPLGESRSGAYQLV